MKKILSILLTVLVVLSLFSMSAGAEQDLLSGQKVGVSWYGYASTSAIRNLDYLVYRLKERGCEVFHASADSSVEKQIADIESFVEQGVEMILLNPCQQDGFQAAFQAAKEAGIPIILLGNALDPTVYTPGVDYAFFMRNDHLEQGHAAGRFAKQVAEEELKGTAYCLTLFGSPGITSSVNRCKGFTDEIEGSGNVVSLSVQTARNKAAEAQNIVENYLMSSGGPEVDAGLNTIVCMTHNCAIGAVAGVINMGYELNKDVYVIEVDGVKESLKSIIDGDMYAAVESPAFYADDAIELVDKWLAGETMETEYILPFKLFTIENAQEWHDNFAKYDELIGLVVD